MANHVSTYVEFRKLNDAGKELLSKLISRIREDGTYRWFGDMWVDGTDQTPTYQETEQYVWTTENIGPKWCYVEEVGEDYIRLTSAWSWPEQGIEWLVNQLAAVDPKVLITCQFDDEMPNFIGVAVYDRHGFVDGFEDDWDQIKDRVTEEHPEIDELEEESEEWWDAVHEKMYEVISDAQWSYINEVVSHYEPSEE